MRTKEKVIYGILLGAALLLLIALGPMDCFSHGYYCEEISYHDIYEEDRLGYVDLTQDYETVFSPQAKHFAGFEINLANHPAGSSGSLLITTCESDGKEIETIQVELSEVTEYEWYMVYTTAAYRSNREYIVRFHTEDCDTVPCLQLVDNDYLPAESCDNQLLLSYAYAQSTFTFQEKVLFTIFLLAILVGLYGAMCNHKVRKQTRTVAVLGTLIVLFAWNYMYNSFDRNANDGDAGWFTDFQVDSETLVTGSIEAYRNGVARSDRYGLGRWENVTGTLYDYQKTLPNDDTWDYGYHRSEPKICVFGNNFAGKAVALGGTVTFANGDTFTIVNLEQNGSYLYLTLDSDRALLRSKYGDLEDAVFAGGQVSGVGIVSAYNSQYGLQGKIFRKIALMMGEDYLDHLWLLCSLATAVVLVLIAYLVGRNYNWLLGVCFGVTFLLSPWVVCFARNLYWVEFTWFLPMLTGLICSWKVHNRLVRLASYAAAFVTVTVKCLCGYEYITVVMLGLIAFLMVDLIEKCIRKDKKEALLLLRTIVILGVMALLGFTVAICLHAKIRGNGDVLAGLQSIYETDVLRRIMGGSLNDFGESYWASLNASAWDVLKKYFHFSTQVLPGIDGNVFPLLCVLPIAIFCCDYAAKRLKSQQVAMYMVFFVTCISWFVLGKAHSYIHTHLSFVLWYFGYVQICLYVVVDKIRDMFMRKRYV